MTDPTGEQPPECPDCESTPPTILNQHYICPDPSCGNTWPINETAKIPDNFVEALQMLMDLGNEFHDDGLTTSASEIFAAYAILNGHINPETT